MKILSTGYQLWSGKFEEFAATVKSLDAVVVDCRLKPWSRDAEWRKYALDRSLGPRHYRHVIELGNLNYKGGPIAISNLEVGSAHLIAASLLQPAVLMCACWNPERCHRTHILKSIPGLTWEEFGPPKPPPPPPTDPAPPAPVVSPAQLELFPKKKEEIRGG